MIDETIEDFPHLTSSDTLTERDSLIENIFPKLKDYCREKYGLEFQVRHIFRSKFNLTFVFVEVCRHAMGNSIGIGE